MDAKAILNLVKPVIIVTIAVVGWMFSETFFSKNLFLAVAILSLVFRGKAILAGFKAIINVIKPKKETEKPLKRAYKKRK